jgi:hypothetical protein
MWSIIDKREKFIGLLLVSYLCQQSKIGQLVKYDDVEFEKSSSQLEARPAYFDQIYADNLHGVAELGPYYSRKEKHLQNL